MNKYAQITERLLADIANGKYKDGMKLPPEEELCKEFDTSRGTIRKVIRHLSQMGKIVSLQGSGHYVRQQHEQLQSDLNELTSITQIIRQAGLVEGDMEVQIFKRRAAADEIELLQLEPAQTWLYVIDRIRTAGGEPVVYSKNMLPLSVVGEDFPRTYKNGSLLEYLLVHEHIKVDEALAEIRTVGQEEELPYRMQENHGQLLKFIQVHYDAYAKPVFLSYDYMRNDMIRFFVRRTRRRVL